MKQVLTPSFKDLSSYEVLMMAWKKTSSYLRYNNWYADTLGIDYIALQLPSFIKGIQSMLVSKKWENNNLMVVPAPKNQRWIFDGQNWQPSDGLEDMSNKIRLLAHVDLHEQVIATAAMLCLADNTETILGNPCPNYGKINCNYETIAYGHRLLCDKNDGSQQLRHRWGSKKLYRQYYYDYQTFLTRPKKVAKNLIKQCEKGNSIAIVQTDLSQFYDRVRPEILINKLERFCKYNNDNIDYEFYEILKKLMNWHWADKKRAEEYSKNYDIQGFENIALPQGLVSSGFFANIVLSDLDTKLRDSFGKSIDILGNKPVVLQDACYYVDDFRFVFQIPNKMGEDEVKEIATTWLNKQLEKNCPGQKISEKKTEVTIEGRETPFLILQSVEAKRIQHQASNTFDMIQGADLITSIEAFFNTQKRYSTNIDNDKNGSESILIGIPDMRDDTVARFAANRFRKTFRSLRPLLEDSSFCYTQINEEGDDTEGNNTLPNGTILTKEQLDSRAKFFSAILINEWFSNPSNIRLLRVALDIFPSHKNLRKILRALSINRKKHLNTAELEIRTYCLSELFRAGATETGFVSDKEYLPKESNLSEYHKLLVKKAKKIFSDYLKFNDEKLTPWYLIQQVMLYLCVRNVFFDIPKSKINHSNKKYFSLYFSYAKFLRGEMPKKINDIAIFLVMAKSTNNICSTSFNFSNLLTAKTLQKMMKISPAITREIWLSYGDRNNTTLKKYAQGLGIEEPYKTNKQTVASWAANISDNVFYQEKNFLSLAYWLFDVFKKEQNLAITPWNIECKKNDNGTLEFKQTKSTIVLNNYFSAPSWCITKKEKQKFIIGAILRYSISGSIDYMKNYNESKIIFKNRYCKPLTHWQEQQISSFQGRSSLGPPWIPLSSFCENLLFELLRWPGCGIVDRVIDYKELFNNIKDRIKYLETKMYGHVSDLAFLEQNTQCRSQKKHKNNEEKLRVGIVQTIIPNMEDFKQYGTKDLTLSSDKNYRRKHSAHIATVMSAISQMLRVRESHRPINCDINIQPCDNRVIDILIFPELAIHPEDIKKLIIPFIRTYKCIVLFGQVYHAKIPNKSKSKLINTCMWILPEWNDKGEFSIKQIEQGKEHLAKNEKKCNNLIGFRPAQWLIKYQWGNESTVPLTLTASICYDATDIKLMADIREQSDLYIVCALNKDINTFDLMAESLHYHIYQGLILVNNGEYGGSSIYFPFKDKFKRQVLHLHGQPQASIAFAEISPAKLLERPNNKPKLLPEGKWKTQPAGWKRRSN